MRAFETSAAKTLGGFLAHLERDRRPAPVLFLGAGCSLSAGCPSEKELLADVSQVTGAKLASLDDFAEWPPDVVDTFFRQHFQRVGSYPYDLLAHLIKYGCFDVILTTNWDTSLESSLHRWLDTSEFSTYVRTIVPDETIAETLKRSHSKAKYIKLHGEHPPARQIMEASESLEFSQELESALRNCIQERGIIIVGYALKEPKIVRLIARGCTVWYVDPVPANKQPMLAALSVHQITTISGTDAQFDLFMEGLCWDVLHAHHRSRWGLPGNSAEIPLVVDPSHRKKVDEIVEAVRVSLRRSNIDHDTAHRWIKRLLMSLRDAFRADHASNRPDVCLIFVHDPRAPGGSEIVERIRTYHDLQIFQNYFDFETITVQGSVGVKTEGRKVVEGSFTKRLGHYRAVVVVDDVAFSGHTLEVVRKHLEQHHIGEQPMQFYAATLVMNSATEKGLVEAGWQVFCVEIVKGHYIKFPWGCIRTTLPVPFDERISNPIDEFLPAGSFGYLPKPWGASHTVRENQVASTKVLYFDANQRTSVHYHLLRKEIFFVLDDAINLRLWDHHFELRRNDSIAIPPGVPHQIIALDQPCRLLEVSLNLCDQKRDIIRLSDPFAREPRDDGDI